MLKHSVGKNGMNHVDDVKTVQQMINFRDDLRGTLPKLIINGIMGSETQNAINKIQSLFLRTPDGRIDPYGTTIQRMWPETFCSPTIHPIRVDGCGSGHFGTPRGKKTHDGVDFMSYIGHAVKAPMSGKITRISRPYTEGIDAHILSGFEIIGSKGTTCWIFYVQPNISLVGTIIKAGITNIGIAQSLQNRYKERGMTNHVHVRLHNRFGSPIKPSDLMYYYPFNSRLNIA